MIKFIWFALLFIAFVFAGCSGAKEVTEIKLRVIKPDVIEDSIKLVTVTDTVIVGNEIVKHDTTTIVKYFPQEKKFYIKVKPDSILIIDTIKTKQIIEKKIETPLLSKLGLVLIGAIVGMILIIIRKEGVFK